MIKRYNQFVDDKINEEFTAGPEQAPAPTRRETETPTRPDTDRPTAPRPTRPGVIPDDVPSEQDNPLAKNNPFDGGDGGFSDGGSQEFDGEVEEEDPYIAKLKELAVALKLGEDVVQNNRIILKKNPEDKGKEITFPSETGKFHVDRKKFDTVEQVVDYLNGGTTPNAPKLEDEDRIDPEFEAKSYRFSRRERRLK
jgi:hypothetical protein